MRKLLIATISLLSCSAYAATWEISEVKNKDNQAVGYIYHTSSVGTQYGKKPEKVVTGLRMVCSVKPPGGEPVVAIYWNTLDGNVLQLLDIKVDDRPIEVGMRVQWQQDGPLLYRNWIDSSVLLQSMKIGRTISFEWTGPDSVRRKTIFSLDGYNNGVYKFGQICNPQ